MKLCNNFSVLLIHSLTHFMQVIKMHKCQSILCDLQPFKVPVKMKIVLTFASDKIKCKHNHFKKRKSVKGSPSHQLFTHRMHSLKGDTRKKKVPENNALFSFICPIFLGVISHFILSHDSLQTFFSRLSSLDFNVHPSVFRLILGHHHFPSSP